MLSSSDVSENDIKISFSREDKVVSLNAMALRLTKTIQDEEQALKDQFDWFERKETMKHKNKRVETADDISLEDLIAKLTNILPENKVKGSKNSKKYYVPPVDTYNSTNTSHTSKSSFKPLKYLRGSKFSDIKSQILPLTEPPLPFPKTFRDSHSYISPKTYSSKEIHAVEIIQAYFRGYQVRRITSCLLKSKMKKERHKLKPINNALQIKPLQDIPISSLDLFGNKKSSSRFALPDHVKPLFELTETGDINAYTESYIKRNFTKSKPISCLTLEYDGKLDKTYEKVAFAPPDIPYHKYSTHNSADKITLSNDEIDLKAFCTNKNISNSYSSVQSVYQTLTGNSSRTNNLRKKDLKTDLRHSKRLYEEDDQSYNDATEISSAQIDSSIQPFSSQTSIHSIFANKDKNLNSNSRFSSPHFRLIEKNQECNSFITNLEQLSPSHLKSKVNAELVFQDTIGSALSHLQDLQNIQAISKVQKLSSSQLGHSYNARHHAESQLDRNNSEAVQNSSIGFQANIEKLEKELNIKISKIEQDVRNKVKNLLDSASKTDNRQDEFVSSDVNLSERRQIREIEKENSWNSRKYIKTSHHKGGEKPLLNYSSDFPEKELKGQLTSLSHKSSTLESNKSNESETKIKNNSKSFITELNETLNSGTKDITSDISRKSSAYSIDTSNVQMSRYSPIKISEYADDFLDDDYDLKAFRSQNNELFLKNLNDASKTPSVQSKDISLSKDVSKHSSNTYSHLRMSENIPVPLSNNSTSSENTLISEISFASSLPNKISFHDNISPNAKSFDDKHMKDSPTICEFKTQSTYNNLETLSELELHSLLLKKFSDQEEISSLTVHESHNGVPDKGKASSTYSESLDHYSGASDTSESQSKPEKQKGSSDEKMIPKCSIVTICQTDENEHLPEGHLESPKNCKSGALQSILNHLTSLQKEEEIRFNHQKEVFKLQEQFLIEEAKLKLISVNSEGGSNIRKRKRAILLQLREQRAHLRRLIETQNLTAQQRQLFFAQHYSLLASTASVGNGNRISLSDTHSPIGCSNLDLSSSEGFENLSSVSSLSKGMKKLCSSLGADERNTKKKMDTNVVEKEEENWLSQAHIQPMRDHLKRKEDKNKKGKDYSKYLFVDTSKSKSDESDNIVDENSKKIYDNRTSITDISQTLKKENEICLSASNLSENQTSTVAVDFDIEKHLNSDLETPEVEHKSDLKSYSENNIYQVEKPADVPDFEGSRRVLFADKDCDKAKSDSEIGFQSNQTFFRNSVDERRRRKNYNGFPFTLRCALSPRSPSLPYRRQSSESDDSFNLSQNETISDISDGEGKLVALREELALRKAEAERLKKERKKIIRERISYQEQALRNQITAYENFIQRKNLEIERETQELISTVTVKPLIKKPFVAAPKTPQTEELYVSENLTDVAIIDESLLSDNSSTTENFCKLSNTRHLNNNVTKIICSSEQSLSISDANITNLPIKENEKLSNSLHEKDDSSEPVKDFIFDETFSIPSSNQSISSSYLHDEERQSDGGEIDETPTTEVLKPAISENVTREKTQLVIKLNSTYDSDCIKSKFIPIVNLEERKVSVKDNINISQSTEEQNKIHDLDIKNKNEDVMKNSSIKRLNNETPEFDVAELTVLKPNYQNSTIKKASLIADNILESLVKESVGCIKTLFKSKNDQKINKSESLTINTHSNQTHFVPKEFNPIKTSLNISKNKADKSPKSDKEISITGIMPILGEEFSSTNEAGFGKEDNFISLAEKTCKGNNTVNKELSSALLHIQSTSAEFYNDTDINETFSISSCEGEWLEGEFWKTNEKIKSQNELREEEDLINKEIARLEELQRFKELYPNLVIREVPDKPPPPYTPPKGEISPTVAKDSLKLPEPQTPSNTISVPHRLSKADLRKIASDIVNVVPTKEEIILTITNNCTVLYSEWHKEKNPNDVHFSSVIRSGISDAEETDASETSESAFNYLLFNLTRQFVFEVYILLHIVPPPVWATHFSHPKKHLNFNKNVTEEALCNHVTKNVRVVFGIDSITKRESAMMKWALKKKEPVDQILVQELQMEELSWIQYHEEEAHIKTQLSQEIFSSLIEETICVFKSILAKTLS